MFTSHGLGTGEYIIAYITSSFKLFCSFNKFPMALILHTDNFERAYLFASVPSQSFCAWVWILQSASKDSTSPFLWHNDNDNGGDGSNATTSAGATSTNGWCVIFKLRRLCHVEQPVAVRTANAQKPVYASGPSSSPSSCFPTFHSGRG